MHSKRALRVTLLTLILLVSSVPCILLIPSAQAAGTGGSTMLYFTEYDPLALEEFGSTNMSLSPPTSVNDSQWPPSLFKKEQGKLLPVLNVEEILNWIMFWAFSQFDNEGEGDEFVELFADLFNPFRVQEEFTYLGEETTEISGEIIFDLYFSSKSGFLRNKDNVKVSISKYELFQGILPLPEEVKNTTATITPALIPGTIKEMQISLNLENESILLEPGDAVLFSVEVIPSERVINKLLNLSERFGFGSGEKLARIANWLSERNIEALQNLGVSLTELVNITEELGQEGLNLTVADLGEITDALQGSSFVFGSSAHPSKVIVPLTIAGDEENTRIYYLHAGGTMDAIMPADTTQEVEISEAPVSWNASSLERSKILTQASANLYLNSRNIRLLKKITITASLLNGGTTIATSFVELPRDFFLLTKPSEPVVFQFSDMTEEISYGERLSLSVAFGNGSKPGLLQKVKLLFDSETYPSQVIARYSETDHIKADITSDPSNGKIVPGDSVSYTLEVSSTYADDISLDITTVKDGDWDVTIQESLPLSITAGGTQDIHVTVASTNNKKEAYGDDIELSFVVSGKTGLDKHKLIAEVSEDAIDYDVTIVGYTQKQTREKGKNATFYFIVENNNTGAIDDVDSYTLSASSENSWNVLYTESIHDLVIGDKTGDEEILVIVSVPKETTEKSDTITFTVTSDSNPQTSAFVTVTLKVGAPGLVDTIYNFFDELAKKLGLDEIFGEYAPHAIMALLLIVIFFIIIILVLVLTKRIVEIICTKRIQEIYPDETATFEILLKNPNKKTVTYQVSFNGQFDTKKWEVSLDKTKVSVPGKQTCAVLLFVTPKATIEAEDWTEVQLKVTILGKKKMKDITTMTSIKKGNTVLQIKEVFTWPKTFKKGDRIITSFKLENKGNITARNINVILFINGEEKNKVEVTIPPEGYADIRIPWIAEKGKNDLHLKVLE